MKARSLFISCWRSVSRHRLRTFFMSIGIVVGVASLVVGRSLGDGADREFRDKIDKIFGPGTIIVVARAKGPSPRPGPVTTLKISDLERIGERLPQIVDWDPAVGIGGAEVRYGDRTRDLVVSGHSDRAERVWNRGVIAGRFLAPDDMRSAARVALIGTTVARDLFDEADPLGREILINQSPFEVVGVLEPIGIDPHGMDRDEDVMIPATTAMRRMRNIDYIGSAKLVVRDPECVDEDAQEVEAVLRELHGIGPGENDDFHTYTSRFAGRRAAEANKVMQVYLPAAAAIVLLMAGLVIANVMLMSLRQRIAEIGLRKAVGATATAIHQQFLVESVAVAVLSGALGALLGVVGVGVAARVFAQPTALSPLVVGAAFAAAVVVGVLAGWIPARRAARLDPVQALR